MSAVSASVHSDIEEVFRDLAEGTFFAYFPEELLKSLFEMAQIEKIEPGVDILVEGEVNTKLYVLVEGEVCVEVGGEGVAKLREKGKVIGEMSLITETPCSATVKTMCECSFLSFDHPSIRHVTEKNNGEYGAVFYKVFAKVLSEKLTVTNDKARRFERANAELKKLYKELDEVNQRRLEELTSQHHLTFQRIHQIYQEDMLELTKEVSRFGKKSGMEMHEIEYKVEHVQRALKPLSELYSSSKALESKKVLLAESDKKQQRLAKMAMRGSGLDIEVASTVGEARGLLETGQFHIIMISEDLIEVAEIAHRLNKEMKLVMMSSQSVSEYIQYFQEYPFLSNVVSRNEEDRTFTIKNIFTTVGKLSNEDIFGLEKYVAWGADIQSAQVERSDQRAEILEEMSQRFSDLGIRQSVIERCAQVGEEMLMNAIYDAPVDEDGNSLYNHKERSELVRLTPDQHAVFRYACDGMLAAISIADPFGALHKDTLMAYLEGCYAGNENFLHQGKGGGGRGIHLMVETADLTVFNVQQGFRTEVIAIFNVDKKISDQIKTPSFHLFYR